ncbi:MAG: DUF3570 domain-containing protein [bacterium]
MQLSASSTARGVAAVALLSLARSAAAAPPVYEERKLSYLFHYFADSDKVHVSSHYSDALMRPSEGTELALQWGNQTVVIPGIAAPPGSSEALDAITSASRPVSSRFGAYDSFTKSRNQLDAELRGAGCKAGYYVSKESDYLAQQVRGVASRDFMDRALNLAAGSSYSWDRITPLQDDDTAGGDDWKRTWHGDLVATHALTPTTLVRAGVELNAVNGLQHNPYRNILAGETRVAERHPDTRLRRDLYVRLNQYLTNRSSVKLSYILYADDWGLRSQTAGVELNQYITGNVVAGYRYRFYDQGSADFYREEYASSNGVDGFLSADYRLSDFEAHLFGGDVEWRLGNALREAFGGSALLDGVALTMRYERYFNTHNFSANILESGLEWAF